MPVYLLVAFFLVWLVLEAAEDAAGILIDDAEPHQLKRLQAIFHITGWCKVALVTKVVLILCFGATMEAFKYGTLVAAFWWCLFDPILNVFRGKEMFYVGFNGYIDRGTRKIAEWIDLPADVTSALLKVILLYLTAKFALT